MDIDLLLFLSIILLSLASMITNFTLYKFGKRLSDMEDIFFNVRNSDPRIDQKFG